MKCTIYKNIYEFKNPYVIGIEKALERIKNGESKAIVEMIRMQPDKEKRDSLKKRLPCVVFSGVFEARRDDAVKEYSGLLCLDFDDVDDIDSLKSDLGGKNYVFAFWTSPSGNGVKALVRIANPKKHKQHFDALKEIYPNIDPSCSNISRCSYESYDPDLYINPDAECFNEIIEEEVEIKPSNNLKSNNTTYEKLKTWLNNQSETFSKGNRNNYIYKLASACCRFGLSRNTTLDLLLRDFSTSNFNQKEIEITVKSAYRSNQINSASFDNDRVVTKKSKKKISIEELDKGFENFDHVIFANDVKNQADAIYNKGYENLDGINCPIFDYHFKAKRQELTLMTGYGNMGKSTQLLWFLLNRAVLYDEKFAVFSPESVPAEEWYLELVEMMAGGDCSAWNKDRISKEMFDKFYDFVGEHFYFVYPKTIMPTAKAIKAQFLELIIKYDIDGVVIDPFNQLYHNRGKIRREDFYLEQTLSDFTKYAQENNIYFFLVAHPTGGVTVTDDGNFKCPTMYNISGGAMWSNKMHNIFIYHRPYSRSEPTNPEYILKFDKIKKKKSVGKTGEFRAKYILSERRFKMPFFDSVTKEYDFDNCYDPLMNNMRRSGFLDDLNVKVKNNETKEEFLENLYEDDDSEVPF